MAPRSLSSASTISDIFLNPGALIPFSGEWYLETGILARNGRGGREGTTPELASCGTRTPPPQEYEMTTLKEVLDLTEYARRQHWWNRMFGHQSGPMVEKYLVATQIAMGGVTGWCAGFLFQKVGKLTATAVSGGFLLLQIASHSGYVQIDWKRVGKDVNKAERQIKKRANKAAPELNSVIEEATEFIKQNIVISSGFVEGFLLGLAS
ncbi:FUN14 domain-containing protein 1-like [Heterocephalus glaber]|uniref:FUN14 domain-containing protein 1-like n=2 Tax=Heterocephalus glaber TaxID=10181 RepID=A0AAX6TJ52_HETGA|nr:FUN14 domain-containing protein 1-like [Heterocephalus glaber]